MTGDSKDLGRVTMFPDGTIKTRPVTKEYETGWDRIWARAQELNTPEEKKKTLDRYNLAYNSQENDENTTTRY